MTHHTLLIFKSDKSFEFLASQDGDPDDGLRAFLLVFFGSGSHEMSLCLTLKLFSPVLFNASKTRGNQLLQTVR